MGREEIQEFDGHLLPGRWLDYNWNRLLKLLASNQGMERSKAVHYLSCIRDENIVSNFLNSKRIAEQVSASDLAQGKMIFLKSFLFCSTLFLSHKALIKLVFN